MQGNLQEALRYASIGFKIFPVHGFINAICSCCRDCRASGSKPGKHPACAHGCRDATTDEHQIKAWFSGQPWLNVGIALGPDQLGLDIDPDKGGCESLRAWKAGHTSLALTLTPRVRTGSGGDHYYFRLPPGVVVQNKAGWAPGIDTRSAGGYLIAPPSTHESGRFYKWLKPPETPLAMAPDWLLAFVAESRPKAEAEAEAEGKADSPSNGPRPRFGVVRDDGPCDFASHPGAGQGYRNGELCRLTGIHLSRGDSLATIEALAVAWGERCDPQVPEHDILRKVRDLAKKEAVKAKAGEFQSNPGFQSRLESEAGAEAQELEHEAEAGDWPQLHPDALHGLAGDIVRAIEPETEADPVAVLLSLLTAFGNAVGRGPCFAMNAGTHHANIFTAIVGDTASAKGQSWGIVHRLMGKADSLWESEAISYGMSSGEGLVDRIKDAEAEGDGFALPPERRLLAVETELARPITAMRREGNTLSPLLRAAWDSQTLEVLTRGKSKIRASNAHVSILAHITPQELSKLLSGSVEVANGFSNRFLWGLVRRSKSLPEGGDVGVIEPFILPLASAIEYARGVGVIVRDAEAKALWAEEYDKLTESRPGAFGLATSRAHAQVLRLSLLYALLDGSSVIRVEHLKAALALWSYCEDSARLIFGEQTPEGTDKGRGDHGNQPLDFRLLLMIQATPGIARNALHQSLPSSKRGLLASALDSLEAKGLAYRGYCPSSGSGRPPECWWPGPEPDGSDHGGGHEAGSAGRGMSFGLVRAEASASASAEAIQSDGETPGLKPWIGLKLPASASVGDFQSNPEFQSSVHATGLEVGGEFQSNPGFQSRPSADSESIAPDFQSNPGFQSRPSSEGGCQEPVASVRPTSSSEGSGPEAEGGGRAALYPSPSYLSLPEQEAKGVRSTHTLSPSTGVISPSVDITPKPHAPPEAAAAAEAPAISPTPTDTLQPTPGPLAAAPPNLVPNEVSEAEATHSADTLLPDATVIAEAETRALDAETKTDIQDLREEDELSLVLLRYVAQALAICGFTACICWTLERECFQATRRKSRKSK